MILTISQWLMTFFTVVLSMNIFVHDMNLDKATQEVVANKFSGESATRGPSTHLHPHAEGVKIKTVDPRSNKRRSPFKNHQRLRKKRTQRPTSQSGGMAIAFSS